MKLATTTGDLSHYYDDRSIAAPIEGMSETGFTHLDLSFYSIVYPGSPWIDGSDRWKKEVEACAELSVKTGVDYCQSHAPDAERFYDGEEQCEALTTALKNVFQACRMLSIPNTVIHAIPCAEGKDRFLEKNKAFYRLFEEDAEKCGVDMLTENSSTVWSPQYYLTTGSEMKAFIDDVGLPRLHAVWDTGHGNVQGCDQYSDVVALGPELRALHVQDNYGNRDSHVMPLIGTTNFDDLMRGLIEIGYDGAFTFEADNTLRRRHAWPHYRKNVKDGDRLADPPIHIQKKQIAVMHEVGVWMLSKYNIPVE